MGIESDGVSTQEVDIAVIGGRRRPLTADAVRFGDDKGPADGDERWRDASLTPQWRHDSTDAPARVVNAASIGGMS